jgi:hypothetical protein
MTIELWHAIFQWGSVVLVALTFVFVAGSLWTGNAIRERETVRLEQVEAELARAQTAGRAAPSAAAAAPNDRTPSSPRELEPAARATLLETLRENRPDGPVAIRFVRGATDEPAGFARALADVIEEAGWTLGEADNSGPTVGEPPVGLLVRVSDRGDRPRRAAVLEDALNRAGLGARLERSPAVRDGLVELMVGIRP